MAGHLSASFGYHASGASAQPQVNTPNVSLFSLISNRNTNFTVDLTQKVDANGPNAASLAHNAKAGLASVKQDVSSLRAGMVADIKQAQAEIIAATMVAGYDPQELFPDMAMAPDSVAEMAMGAVNAAGKGSMATHMMNSLEVASVVEAIQNDRAKSPEEARAHVADVLRAASSPSPNEPQFGHVVQANATPDMDETSINWNDVFEEYPDALEAIMNFDEDSYDAKMWPELAEVDAALDGIDLKMAEFENVQFKVEHEVCAFSIDAMDTESLTAQASRIDPADGMSQWDSAGVLAKMLQTPEGLSKVSHAYKREEDLRNVVDGHEVRQVVENNMSPMGAMSA